MSRGGALAAIVGFAAFVVYIGDDSLRAPLTGLLLAVAGLSVVAVGIALRFAFALLTTVAMVTAGVLLSTLLVDAEPGQGRGPNELCDPSCGISEGGLIVIVMVPALGLVLFGAATRTVALRAQRTRTEP